MLESPPKPFLKWAGGKSWLAIRHELLTPRSFGRYYEPFLGAGWMFFSIRPRVATLSDANVELIATYQQVARNSAAVIEILRRWRYDRDTFYSVRGSAPRSCHGAAARFIYLNKTAWNGLYRVNRHGAFNVPFGKFSEPLGNVQVRISDVAPMLKRVRLRACDFEVALRDATRGDFVYLDPPYVSRHRFNGFLRYNARVFSWDDQQRLQDVVKLLDRRGVKFLLSNADHSSIERLYSTYEIHRTTRRSLVAGSVDDRTSVTELLISNFRPKAFQNG